MNKIDRPVITFPNMIKVKLTKISEREDAEVPNNIPVNDYRIGYVRDNLLKPIIGISYGLEHVIEINGNSVHFGHYFITSQVVDTWTENPPNEPVHIIIKTLNSLYKLEVLCE